MQMQVKLQGERQNMPQIALSKDQCPCCKTKLVKVQTVNSDKNNSEYDSCVCPDCHIRYTTNWHPLGEPERLIAVSAA